MRILGIDPGTVKTGWGIIDASGQNMRYIAAGVLKQKSGSDISARLLYFHQELIKIIEQYHPQSCGIESPFVGENVRSAFTLGKAQGVAILAAATKGLSTVEYLPNLVKQRLSGYGHSTKEQLQITLKLLLDNADLPSETDATDALAIAVCHHLQNEMEGLKEY